MRALSKTLECCFVSDGTGPVLMCSCWLRGLRRSSHDAALISTARAFRHVGGKTRAAGARLVGSAELLALVLSPSKQVTAPPAGRGPRAGFLARAPGVTSPAGRNPKRLFCGGSSTARASRCHPCGSGGQGMSAAPRPPLSFALTPTTRLMLHQGDIAAFQGDVIVCPTNEMLAPWWGAGASGAIARAGGDGLLDAIAKVWPLGGLLSMLKEVC